MVVHPSGTLAYASTEDLREGARLRAEEGGAAGGPEGGADRPGKRTAPEEDGSEEEGEQKVPVGLAEQVDLAAGTYKYVCLRVTPAGSGAAPCPSSCAFLQPGPRPPVRRQRGSSPPSRQRWGSSVDQARGGGGAGDGGRLPAGRDGGGHAAVGGP